jgi:hypothetical protein
LQIWSWKNRFLHEDEDFTFISEALARHLTGQNIRYAEVYFSPSDHAPTGMQPAGIAMAIRALILNGVRSSWLERINSHICCFVFV